MSGQRISDEKPDFVIRKNGYFYRPNRAGYTSNIDEAGRYTESDAKAEAQLGDVTAHLASDFRSPLAAKDAEIARLTAERDEARAERDQFLEQAAIRSDSFNECQRVMAAHNATITAFEDLQSRYNALLAERAGVSEAMVERAGLAVCRAHNCGLSLKGVLVLCDDPRLPDDVRGTGLGGGTCDCREDARIGLEAALAIPIPTPVDRGAIRAEAFEEAAKIAEGAFKASSTVRDNLAKEGHEVAAARFDLSLVVARDIASAMRSAAKTEASR